MSLSASPYGCIAPEGAGCYFKVCRRRCLSIAFMTIHRDLDPPSYIRVVGRPWWAAASPGEQIEDCPGTIIFDMSEIPVGEIVAHGRRPCVCQVRVDSGSFSAARRARIAAAMKTRDRP